MDVAMKQFSKAIFKFAFYLCVFLDNSYRNTSIMEVGGYLRELVKNNEGL